MQATVPKVVNDAPDIVTFSLLNHCHSNRIGACYNALKQNIFPMSNFSASKRYYYDCLLLLFPTQHFFCFSTTAQFGRVLLYSMSQKLALISLKMSQLWLYFIHPDHGVLCMCATAMIRVNLSRAVSIRLLIFVCVFALALLLLFLYAQKVSKCKKLMYMTKTTRAVPFSKTLIIHILASTNCQEDVSA